MPRSGPTFGDQLVGMLAVAYIRATLLVPLSWARAITVFLGRLALRAVPRLHRVGMENLDLAYGDTLSRAEKARILRGAMDNMAIVAAEFSRLPLLGRDGPGACVEVRGAENVMLDRPALFISGHISNWELMAASVPRFGINMSIVVRPLNPPRLNSVVDAIRRAASSETMPKEDAGTTLLRLLKEGRVVGLLADQAPRENAVPVTFFGKPCWATIAPVMIAVRAKVPVQPVSMLRRPDGGYIIEALPPIEMVRTGDLRRDLVENTQRCQDVIESLVRAHPEQWLWFHRRWKSRERLEAEWNARMQRDKQANNAASPQES